MRKTFSFVLVCMFAFLFSVVTASASAVVKSEACLSCHQPAMSDDAKRLITPALFEKEGVQALVQSPFLLVVENGTAVQALPVFLSGKTSRSIQPFFTADIPGQPYAFMPFDYMEEPSNPVTDYDGMQVDPDLITQVKLE